MERCVDGAAEPLELRLVLPSTLNARLHEEERVLGRAVHQQQHVQHVGAVEHGREHVPVDGVRARDAVYLLRGDEGQLPYQDSISNSARER